MNIVSGSRGFIGKHLVKRLSEDTEIVYHEELNEPFYPKHFDTYFYLSGYGNHSQQQDIHQTVKANVEQLEQTLSKISQLNFKNFIHISTSSVKLKQQTPYSRTKSWAEDIVYWYAQKTGKGIFSVRPYSIFGEGEADFRFIPTMVRNLVNKETPKLDPYPAHDWVYVEDFIDALLVLADKVHEPIPPQEVGYGYATTNRQVFDDIKRILGLPGKVKYEKAPRMRSYDVTRSWYKQKPDYLDEIWEPRMGYWQGLKKTVNYYKELYGKKH
jgi:nucleoside-diphosphate-sugar epimerase